MEIRWSLQAANDLKLIYKRIAKNNPAQAREAVTTLYDGCAALNGSPEQGQPGRMKGRCELAFAPLPYIAVYRIKEEAVEISRIYHGAQDWP